jgi:hypothetical protein
MLGYDTLWFHYTGYVGDEYQKISPEESAAKYKTSRGKDGESD